MTREWKSAEELFQKDAGYASGSILYGNEREREREGEGDVEKGR